MRNRTAWIFALVGTSILSAACGGDASSSEPENVSSSLDDLYKTGTLWPSGSVHVCWDPASMGRADFAAISSRVRLVPNDAWGRVANVWFWGFTKCAGETNSLIVSIVDAIPANDPNSNTLGQSGVGYRFDSDGNTRMSLVNSGAKALSDYTIVHEFGHTLGFAHETARSDFNDGALNCDKGDIGGGDTYNTPKNDTKSIMLQTACAGGSGLSVWDIVGVQSAYGRKAPGSMVGWGNKCLDVPNGNYANGALLDVWDCQGADNQKWSRNSDGTIYNVSHPSAYLDVKVQSPLDESPLEIFARNTPVSTNQQFQFGAVEIRGIGEKCLDIPNANFFAGQGVDVYSCHNADNQKWNVLTDGTIYTVQKRADGTTKNWCLDIPGGNASNGTALQIYDCNGGQNQKFGFSSRGEVSWGGKCFDVAGTVPASSANAADLDPNGKKVSLYTCKANTDSNKANQLWHLSGEVRSGLESGGKCLDIRGGSGNGMRAQIYTCHGSENQRWDYYFAPNGAGKI